MTTLGEGESVLNEAALEAFADRMIVVLNDASTALMISIGHQTGCLARCTELARRRRHKSPTSPV
jgi:hypothetical protein